MEMQMHHYRRFLIMIALHFLAMYVFMYAMVNAFGQRIQQLQPGLYGSVNDCFNGAN